MLPPSFNGDAQLYLIDENDPLESGLRLSAGLRERNYKTFFVRRRKPWSWIALILLSLRLNLLLLHTSDEIDAVR